MNSPLRTCKECGYKAFTEEDLSRFPVDGNGYRRLCKTCYNAHQRKLYASDTPYRRSCKRERTPEEKARNAAWARHKRASNLEKFREYDRIQRQTNIERFLIKSARTRSLKNNIPFDITSKDVTIPEFCPVLNIPLKVGIGKLTPNSPTIDRIKPELGYVKGNVCVISHRANRIKSDGTLEEHQLVVKYLKKHNK